MCSWCTRSVASKFSEKHSPIIRRVRAEDIDAIFNIELLSFKEPYPKELLRTLLIMCNETFLVAELSGKIVGYVISLIRRGYLCHVISIAVHPKYRRRGIATQLMIATEELARKLGSKLMRLEVRVSNHAARKLYEKLGFSESYVIGRYYRNGEPAVVMYKLLV